MNITVLLTGESVTIRINSDAFMLQYIFRFNGPSDLVDGKSVHLVDLRNLILIHWPYTPFSKNEKKTLFDPEPVF